jgi:hypothetical protein
MGVLSVITRALISDRRNHDVTTEAEVAVMWATSQEL